MARRLTVKGDYVQELRTLIAMARAKVHTDRELAERIGESPQNLAGMKAGRRAISPETVIAMCDLLGMSGEETREWVAVAIISNPKNSSRAEVLRRALFACWVLGVGSLLTTQSDVSARTIKRGEVLRAYNSVTHPIYIVAHLLTVATRLFDGIGHLRRRYFGAWSLIGA